MTLKRMAFMQELLDFVGFGGRLHLEWISSAEAQKFVQVVGEFTEKIRRLGPNPLKCRERAAMILGPKALAGPTERTRHTAPAPHHQSGQTRQETIGRST